MIAEYDKIFDKYSEKSYTEFINKGKRSDKGRTGAHTPIWREEGMKKRCSNKGFSLVELIIVIAIMAILIGVMAFACWIS